MLLTLHSQLDVIQSNFLLATDILSTQVLNLINSELWQVCFRVFYEILSFEQYTEPSESIWTLLGIQRIFYGFFLKDYGINIHQESLYIQ